MNRKPMVMISSLGVALATTLCTLQAGAAVLDFDAVPDNGISCDGGTCNFLGSTYEENGFQIVNSGVGGIASWDSTNSNFTGSKAIFPNDGFTALTLTAAGGQAFNIESIDISELLFRGGVTQINFFGTKADGSPDLNLSFWLDGEFGNQTISFIGWNNLSSVSWGRASIFGDGGQYDNIVVSTVPVPAAAPLFGSAIGLLGYLGWRKRKQARSSSE